MTLTWCVKNVMNESKCFRSHNMYSVLFHFSVVGVVQLINKRKGIFTSSGTDAKYMIVEASKIRFLTCEIK